MIIPVFQNVQFVEEDGFLTASQQLWFDELIQTLQNNFSVNGLEVPSHTTAQITVIAQTVPAGTIFFDTDVAKLKVVTAAAIVAPPTPAVVEQITSV